MPTSARWEVTNSPQIPVKTVQSAGSMRRPQASFEAQPRIARLLAPKMGIDPYRQVGKCIWIRPGFPKKALHPAGGQSRPPLQSWYSSKTLRVLTCCRPGRTVRGGFSYCGAKSLQGGNKFLHDCTFLLCPYVVQCIRIFMLLCCFGQIWIDRGRSSWNYSLPPVRWRRCAPPSATALTLFI